MPLFGNSNIGESEETELKRDVCVCVCVCSEKERGKERVCAHLGVNGLKFDLL